MFRLIGFAVAAAVGAWLVVRRKRFGPPKPRTSTTIVIGGSGQHPIITRQPDTLVAKRGQELVWEIRNETNDAQTIGLRGFGKKDPPPAGPLFGNKETSVPAGRTGEIRDRVTGTAVRGTYKYSIFLNGVEAVDPDVIIYEEV